MESKHTRTCAQLVDFGSRSILVRANFGGNATAPCSPCKQSAPGGDLATLHALRQIVVVVILHLQDWTAEEFDISPSTSAVMLMHHD